MPSSSSFKLLFLGAGPDDLPRLRQEKERKKIARRLGRGRCRDHVELVAELAVSPGEIAEHLVEHNPAVVHISTHGYGASTDQLAFEDGDGLARPVSVDALSELFAAFKENARCVVLSACFSETQARAIARHIDCVIGVAGAVEDRVAIRFAVHLHGALAAGKSVGKAFQIACGSVRVEGYESEPFRLIEREGIDANGVTLIDATLVNRSAGEQPRRPRPRSLVELADALARAPWLRWTAVALSPALLAIIVVWLGAASHRARASLIGLQADELSYTTGELFAAGGQAALHLAWSMLSGLALGSGIERWAVPIAVALALVAGLAVWRGSPRAALLWLALALPVLGHGAVLYANAVGVHHVALPGAMTDWPCELSESLPQRIGFEVCSWLQNDSAINDGRRIALAGLWGWLVLSLGLMFWLAARAAMRAPGPGGRGARAPMTLSRLAGPAARVALAGCYGLVLLFVLMQAPRAHAVGHWGLRYPAVSEVDPACDAELAAIAADQDNSCVILDVSAGAVEEIVIVRGYECPGSSLRSRALPARAANKPAERCVRRHPGKSELILNQG